MSLAVGVDLGGTKTAAGIVAPDGEVLVRRCAPTPAEGGPEAVLATIVRVAAEAIAAAPDPSAVVAAGIGAAGVIDPVARTAVSATHTLPGWAGTTIGARVAAELALPVAVDNDVRAHAVGEARFGAGRGRESVLLLAAGTGLGGALVLGGRPLIGAAGAAGHVGHMAAPEAQGLPCTCGRSGHLEMVSSGPAVRAAYLRAGGSPEVADTREVFARAAAGDELAVASIRTAGRALGRAIGGLLNALDPDVVVVSGGLAQTSDLWWAPLREGVGLEAIDLVRNRPVVAASLGADAAIAGAAALAFDAGRPGHGLRPGAPTRSVPDHGVLR